MSDKTDNVGQRLRERFLRGGGEALADYEMLELLLFQAIPRQDTKPIAKALLKQFGDYATVLRAEPAALMEVEGVGESAAVAIRTVVHAAMRLARAEVMNRPVMSSWDRLIDYLRIAMAGEKAEQFRLLYLDSKNALIADEMQNRGTVNHAPVYPREVVKRALELGATALIMVHNHPSGDPSPSKADIAMTKEVRDTIEKLGIVLHDHVIVGRGGIASFKSLGLL